MKWKITLILFLLVTLAFTTAAISAGRGGGGRPDDRSEDGETAANNLSFPVLFTGEALASISEDLSYDGYQLDGTFYIWDGINTPCDPQDAGCTIAADYLVFLQKSPGNRWQAEWADDQRTITASHIDVSDNLQSVPWRVTSVVRVEFVPFAPTVLRGYEMAYVSGQGVDEVWGAVAQNHEPPILEEDGSGYATLYSPCMRLDLTKLVGGDLETLPPDLDTMAWTGQSWQGDAVAHSRPTDEAISAEINVKGRVIYGYNWFLRNEVIATPAVTKDGWWRLTFYADTTLEGCESAPFNFASAVEGDPTASMEAEPIITSEPEPGGTYPRTAVIDPVHNICHIDVFIRSASSGGMGGGGNGGGSNGGGGKGNGKR